MKAIISSDQKYRYSLSRDGDLLGGSKKGLLFLMLNPSTADAHENDSTIDRCISFSKSFGYDGFDVANLYALRATSRKKLWTVKDPIGPDNDIHLQRLARNAEVIVCAWGEEAKIDRVKAVCTLLIEHQPKFRCLQMNKSGHPRHPLYVHGSRPLSAWSLDSIG